MIAAALTLLGACMGWAPGLYASSVVYRVGFDRAGVEALEVGFATQNDLGYRVELRRGYLVQSSMTLVDCLGVGGDVWDEPTMARALGLFGPPLAHAGHGDEADPSAVVRPMFLDLATAEGELEFGRATMETQRYCRVHHLVTGSYDASAFESVPDGVDPVLTSLVLEGEAERDGVREPFAWRSELASGAIRDLPDVLEGDLAGRYATVVVHRELARTFDGIDFSSATSDEASRQVLRNLVIDAPVTVRIDTTPTDTTPTDTTPTDTDG